MPLKGLVKFMAIALILLSLYQLSFTLLVKSKDSKIAAKVKKQMADYAKPEVKYPGNAALQAEWRDSLELFKEQILQTEENKAAKDPVSWDPFTGTVNYQEAKSRELQLGLDLQGGMSVELEVAMDGLIRSRSGFTKDQNIKKAIEIANQRKANTDANFIKLFRDAYKEINPSGKLAPFFAAASGKEITFESSDEDVVKYLNKEADRAFDNTYNVINKRVDKFGLVQPGITKDNDKKVISLELAGVKNPEKIKKMLQTSANLQFWEIARIGELQNFLQAADQAYSAGFSIRDTSKKNPADTVKHAPGGNFIDDLGSDTNKTGANANKADQKYTYFNLVKMPPSAISNHIGTIKPQDTVFLNEILQSPAFQSNIPKDFRIVYGKPDDNISKGDDLPVYALRTYGATKAPIEGGEISQSSYNNNPLTGKPEVTLSFKPAGESKFAEMTEKLARPDVRGAIAIVLDDIVYSAPNVNEKIANGSASISGGFKDLNEAKDLSDILNVGPLDAPAKIVSDQIVGPTLGKEAVKGGARSFFISFVVIFLLMLVYYNTSGWVANIALILNLLFTVGVLSALGATLTAPGIAGLVLTIGMAVDTNVIIFERIKEELDRGRTYQAAVIEGYKRSLAPVLDAHFTTFLTAFILFIFGLGPIKGFATTQMLGIFLSLFCGILISRLITDWYTNKNRHFKYFTPLSRRVFKHSSFKFIEYRKVAYIITAVVVLLGAGAIFNGFDQGVEYAGGRSYSVHLHKDADAGKLREVLTENFQKQNTIVKSINNSSTRYDITTSYLITDGRDKIMVDSIVRDALYRGVKPYLDAGMTENAFARGAGSYGIVGSKKVEPSISEGLKKGARKAAIISILVIALYIFLRFRDWRYSVGTIVALLHDVFVTLAVFSFLRTVMPFPLELDQHFIAAVLTVIGFSMNDTVIVFDRIREYAKKMKGESKEVIINKAINDTLSRTIMTSLTVFLTILILFIFGGEVTRGFSFAMLIGVITGTYSSIFVAAPILVDMAKDKPLGEADFIDHSNETTRAAEKALKKAKA
jgi:SecD/SecF fusion protein